MSELTCATCRYYMGGGDYNLCCTKRYELCYRNTKACAQYEFCADTAKRLAEQDAALTEYIQRATKK